MVAISSTVGVPAVTQAAFQQLKLQQARQNADRAEQVARSLQAAAAGAQQDADRAQENARSLAVQSRQAQSAAGQARQGLALIRSVSDMEQGLSRIDLRASDAVTSAVESEPVSPVESAPVINTSGQVTGVVVNTTA